jgi:prepilin-type processing-associated H-X9-DG protein
MDLPPQERRKWPRWPFWLLGAFLLCTCLCAGYVEPPLLIFLYLSFGWIWFLLRVLPQLAPDVGGILTGIICLAGLSVGLHLFLRWLHGQIRRARAEPPTLRPDWGWDKSFVLVGVVLLMFVAGIGAVGVTHQVGWLLRSEEPFLESSFRTAVAWIQSQNNLKQIGLAAHSYHDADKHLPPGGTFDEQGRGMHGWQTFLLPYVEQENVFKQVDLKLPWDHPNNSNAMRTQVPVYQNPYQHERESAAGYALSFYTGNVRVLGGGPPLDLRQITDGTSNTLLAGEAADHFLPWGYPRNWRDPARGINTSPDGFGSPAREGGANFVFADGSTRFLTNQTSPAVLKALSTPNGGESTPSLD